MLLFFILAKKLTWSLCSRFCFQFFVVVSFDPFSRQSFDISVGSSTLSCVDWDYANKSLAAQFRPGTALRPCV
jgi:hypothetical protein